MINRALLRIKAVQVLYAYFQTENKTPNAAEKELDKSIEQTYDLYLFMLSLVPALTHFAELSIDNRRNKFLPTDADLNPNTRFADNIFAKQLLDSKILTDFIESGKYSWTEDESILTSLYKSITQTSYYADYMNEDVRSYNSDREIWRKIFKNEVPNSLDVDSLLEELSVYWNDDLDTVTSFVQKTIRHFQLEVDADSQILPLYRSDDDREFVHTLFRTVIANSDQYEAMIDEATKNWELDRIAFMDTLIMKVALAELLTFTTIPVSVTLNEYIEIAKSYSTPRSASFINGVLDRIVSNLKKENKLVKPKEKI